MGSGGQDRIRFRKGGLPNVIEAARHPLVLLGIDRGERGGDCRQALGDDVAGATS